MNDKINPIETFPIKSAEKRIHYQYNVIMHGYEKKEETLDSNNEYYHTLYAPGYDMIGVGDIVAHYKED